MSVDYYTPTLASRAERYIALRAKGHFSGAFVVYFDNVRRIVVFESRLELLTAYVWCTLPGVVDLFDQVRLSPYIDDDGRERHHILDYIAVMADGRRIGLAVKPAGSADRRNFRRTLELIMGQCTDQIDEIRLVTEQSFSRSQAENAELIHFVGSEVDEEADQVVSKVISSLRGIATIESVVDATGLEGRAFRSVIRLIGRGVCRQIGEGRLRYPSVIGRASA